MKPFQSAAQSAAIAGLAGAALALAACHPPHPHAAGPLRTISALDCPDTQGDLTRKSAAADGKSCVYATESGDQVTLQVVGLNGGDARAALAPIEAQFKSEIPAATTASASAKGAGGQGSAGGSDRDQVDIDLPGIHVHAHGGGGADVEAPGVHVHSADHGDGDNAVVQVDGLGGKGVTVNADEGGAQIRVDEGGSGIRAHYVLTGDAPGPHGYRMAGYEARGPAAGPIVVAELLARSDDEDDLRHDIHALIRRNIGGW